MARNPDSGAVDNGGNHHILQLLKNKKTTTTMNKKILILSGSPRHGGNSDMLCDQFIKGAQENGHDVEKYIIADHKIAWCTGCYYCQTHDGECAKKDDMEQLMPKILEADMLVFASPVYMYSISAQLKTVFDRMVAKYETIADKELCYIMTSAEDEPTTMDTALACMRGMADCIPGSKEVGIIYGKGAYEKGEIKSTPAYEAAYQLGKSIR